MKKTRKLMTIVFSSFLLLGLIQCKGKSDSSSGDKVLNIYSSRHYDTDKKIYADFTKETGIQINLVEGKNDEVLQRILQEGENSEADIYLTVGAENLQPLKEKKLLKNFSSENINKNIPKHYRGEGWTGVTSRARVIAYAKDLTDPNQITNYSDLADPKWKGKILVRSSSSSYNIALLASFIQLYGEDKAKEWAESIVKNMARTPKGNDRDQAKAILAGEGELAIMNSYYLVKMLNSSDKVEADVGNKIGLIFPKDTHINLSFGALLQSSKNEENAIRFLEYITSDKIQKIYSEENGEFALNPKTGRSEVQKAWKEFQKQDIDFEELGNYKKEAAFIFDKVGWK